MPSLSQQFGSSGGTCSLISLATRWSLSQYCDALKSGMRDRTGLVELCQSLGRIGSQTTKTRSLSVGNCLSKPSIAEAPRTSWSSGRKQDQHSDFVIRFVEVTFEFAETLFGARVTAVMCIFSLPVACKSQLRLH